MAIPKLKKQDVIDALKFIDENGVPEHNTSVKYVLVSEDGKKYPPKYVVAVADHLANSTDISTESFNSVDAKNYLKSLGFSIETKQQEKFELSITAESVESTDERFTMDNLSLGDNYKPLDAYFKRANGDVIKRAYSKGERRNSNQTLPRIACQVFEKQLAALSVEDKENFPVCKYNPGSDVIRGIYASVDDFKNRRNTIEYLTYGYDNGRQFVIYCWNIFSTIIFVQECLKRFGEPGDQFILTYREKDEKETAAAETEAAVQEELVFGLATTKSNEVTEDTYFLTSTLFPIASALFRRIMQSIMDKTINMVRFEFLLKFLHAISIILFLNERRFLLAL